MVGTGELRVKIVNVAWGRCGKIVRTAWGRCGKNSMER